MRILLHATVSCSFATSLCTGYTTPQTLRLRSFIRPARTTSPYAYTTTTAATQLFSRLEEDGIHSIPGAKPSSPQEATRRTALEQLLTATSTILTTAALPAQASTMTTTQATATAVASSGTAAAAATAKSTTWPLGKVAFSLLPLAGTFTRRATIMETVIEGKIWTLDQIQGVVNVNVPVRMVVIKLSPEAGGGLWIHNPLAPTPQLISYIRQLASIHGPVRHIVLGTVALEHKATLGPFGQYFSKTATIWIQPGQWSFPVQLPIEFLGVVQKEDKLRALPSSRYLHGDISLEEELKSIPEKRYRYWAKKHPLPEWAADIDYETLGPLRFQSVGAYSETAFFHKPTKSLIVTDCVCSVTKDPPAIIEEDPRDLLFHARDSIQDVVVDDVDTRRKGWRRMVQFGLVFFPSQIDVVPFGQAIEESTRIDPSMKSLGENAVPGGSLYPWTWHDNDADVANFDAISQNGKLFCPPILTKLILDREPAKTLEWVDHITQRFDFTHVIPSHLNNYVKADKKQFERAFDPLRSNPSGDGKRKQKATVYPQRALAEDLALLQEASDLLTQLGVVAQSQVCDLEPARQVGRFADIAPK